MCLQDAVRKPLACPTDVDEIVDALLIKKEKPKMVTEIN